MSNITFAPFPIPVIVEGIGECYIVSQTNSGTFEDDLFLVAKCDGGQMFHVRTSQMKMHFNATMGISKDPVANKWTDEQLVHWGAYYAIAYKERPGLITDLLEEYKLKNNIK